MPKWEKADVAALIAAYKAEQCLWSVKSRNYHNKTMRTAAVARVVAAITKANGKVFSPKECLTKLHGIRTQYNLENGKRKESLLAGVTDDNTSCEVYVPSLWYFPQLSFLEENVFSRKHKMRGSEIKTNDEVKSLSDDDHQLYEVEVIDISVDDSPPPPLTHPITSNHSWASSHHQQPSRPPVSPSAPANSLSRREKRPASSSNATSIETTANKRLARQVKREHMPMTPAAENDDEDDDDDQHRNPPKSSIELIRAAPVVAQQQHPLYTAADVPRKAAVVADSVDTSMAFVTSILRELKHKYIQSELMARIVQAALAAKAKDEAEEAEENK